MFDYIGIDWGEKICGVSFGDSATKLVIPSSEETETKNIFKKLEHELYKRRISQVVVGLPLTFHGNKTRITILVGEFITKVQALFPDCSIATINERNTTKDSQIKIGKTLKYQLDNQAAVEILDRYFEKYFKA